MHITKRSFTTPLHLATLQRMMRVFRTNDFARKSFLFGLLVLILSYCTYVQNYATPPALFWDENYHIASAQKYLTGTFFMEPHPPLGKLLIAAGEWLVDANVEDDTFIGTDYAKQLPSDFSFAGYRLFPTLLGWLTVMVFFGICLVITRKPLVATFFTFPVLFDNAQILHYRAAMLDSTMVFFSALMVLLFLLLLEWKHHRVLFIMTSILFGIAFGCVMATKALGLIMILLVPALAFLWRKEWPRFAQFFVLATVACAVVYGGIWQIHFSIATEVHPGLPDGGTYQASQQYKQILEEGRQSSPAAFPIMLRDSLGFLSHYSKGVPALNMCKSDENGSPFYLWPFGARTISYRWETPGNGSYRYLYLVPNPVGWALGLVGVILAVSFLLASVLMPLKNQLRRPYLLLVFLGMYISYMLAVSQLDRVMYLYHYFIPLLFSYILFVLSVEEIRTIGPWKLTEERRLGVLICLGLAVFVAFQWMRPLTYYGLLTNEQFAHRDLLNVWEMRCVQCERKNMLANPNDCSA